MTQHTPEFTPTHVVACARCGQSLYVELVSPGLARAMATPDPWNDPVAPCAHAHASTVPVEVTYTGDPAPLPPEPRGLSPVWCIDCHTRREVQERFDTGVMTRDGEVTSTVTVLECGHTRQTGGRVTAAAPGAPYAGNRPVVSRPSISALVQARLDAALRDQEER